MFVNESIAKEAEARAGAVVSSGPTGTGGGEELVVDLGEVTLGPELAGLNELAKRAPGPHPLWIPSARRARARRAGTATAIEVEKRVRHASFAGAVPSKSERERFIGGNDLVDENYLERGLLAARPVCRLVFKDSESGRPAFATGFMVTPRLLLTNWHVFKTKEDAVGAVAEFDYTLDVRGLEVPAVRFQLKPEVFFASDRTLDFALVSVADTALDGVRELASFGYHRLVKETGKLAKGEPITIIQHPEGGRRQVALRENELEKEPQTGDLFLLYSSDTARGSSGAPAFNDSWQVVALHHSGKARKEGSEYVLLDGQRVTSLDGVPETLVDWVSNEGVRVSVLCGALIEELRDSVFGNELEAAMEGSGDVMSREFSSGRSAERAEDGRPHLSPQVVVPGSGFLPGIQSLDLRAAQIYVAQNVVVHTPLTGEFPVSTAEVRRATDASPSSPGVAEDVLAEKMVTPLVDTRYSTRKGYQEDFLGLLLPVPTVTDKKLVARLDSGSYVIPYEHFSIVMNKKRRLALFTASNVDGSTRARKPESNAIYSRKALGGLGKNDSERWFTDPRIPEEHQLPDEFYTKDRKSFDKGHIVRRDDVCWGRTYAQIRRANGDTFHTTNCSPQVMDFNQSKAGGIWGELENLILKQAKAERLTLFAGPVLAEDDDVFEGVDRRGTVAVQIPRRYWKIVCANAGGNLQAFAFLLEQDLSNVNWEAEFAVDAAWTSYMIAIGELQSLLAGVQFPAEVLAADQFDAQGGEELLMAAPLERVKSAKTQR